MTRLPAALIGHVTGHDLAGFQIYGNHGISQPSGFYSLIAEKVEYGGSTIRVQQHGSQSLTAAISLHETCGEDFGLINRKRQRSLPYSHTRQGARFLPPPKDHDLHE